MTEFFYLGNVDEIKTDPPSFSSQIVKVFSLSQVQNEATFLGFVCGLIPSRLLRQSLTA